MGKTIGAALRSVAVAAGLLLAACIAKNVDKDYVLSETADKGVVIGSIARSSTSGNFWLSYRRTDGSGESSFLYAPGTGITYTGDDDFKGPHLRGTLFAVELPAGEYEIYHWRVDSGSIHIQPTAPFSIRFRVEPGKAVYLGAYTFQRTERFMGATAGVAVSCREERARDMPILGTKFPNFAHVEVASSIEEGRSYENIGGDNATSFTIYIPVIHR